jgi:hypothetical protein
VRPLTLTTWRNVTAAKEAGQKQTRAWEEWISAFSEHERRGQPPDPDDPKAKAKINHNKAGRCFVPGAVDGGRSDNNVASLDALVLDIDGKTEAEVLGAVAAISPYEWHAYSTYSHGFMDKVGLRVLVPLARPLWPIFYKGAATWLNRRVGNLSDDCVKIPSQPYYFPATWRGNPDSALVAHTNHGRWLDPGEIRAQIDISREALTPENEIEVKDRVARMRARLRRVPKDDPYKETILALLRGEPLGEPGNRHAAYRMLTGMLGSMTKDDPLPDASILYLFAGSFAAMVAADPSFDRGQQLLSAYRSSVSKLREAARRERQRQINKALEQQRHGEEPYTAEELKALAAAQEVETEDLAKRWIVQKDTTYWFLGGDARYAGPYSKEEAPIVVHSILHRAPVQLIYATREGVRDVPMRELMKGHGTIPAKTVSDLSVQVSRLDKRRTTFYEAACPLRDLEPRHDPEVELWLKIFAGKHYEKVKSWLACAPDLDKMLCAIYFCGKKSAGKTLFAYGVSRLWTEGAPTSADEVFGSNFNETLLDCPVIHADESLPTKYNGMKAHELLRSLVSVVSRKVRRKYRATSDAFGALRMILSANNEYLLSCGTMTRDDIEAVAEKVLYVEVNGTSADALRVVPREKREWWAREGIARHALWLRDNHYVEPDSRLWVSGSMSDTLRNLLTTNEWTARCVVWCIGYLGAPTNQDTKPNTLAVRKGNKLYVNPQAVIDGWDLYIREKRVDPEAAKIARAMESISKGRVEVALANDKRISCYEIDLDVIFSYAERHMIGDLETMRANLREGGPKAADTNVIVGKFGAGRKDIEPEPAQMREPGEEG